MVLPMDSSLVDNNTPFVTLEHTLAITMVPFKIAMGREFKLAAHFDNFDFLHSIFF